MMGKLRNEGEHTIIRLTCMRLSNILLGFPLDDEQYSYSFWLCPRYHLVSSRLSFSMTVPTKYNNQDISRAKNPQLVG